jgi:hypothetical protein
VARGRRQVRLELRDDGGPPAGVAYGEGGRRREFSGWLGLVLALDALISCGSPPADDGRPEGPGADRTTHRG